MAAFSLGKRLLFALAAFSIFFPRVLTEGAARVQTAAIGRLPAAPSVRKLGLVAAYNPPGLFLLDPDTNSLSGPMLSDRILPEYIICAAITPDGMTGIVAARNYGPTPGGSSKDGMILYFIDLSDPASARLLGTAFFAPGGTYLGSGHLGLTPDGKFVLGSMATRDAFGDHWGDLAAFQISTRALIWRYDAGEDVTPNVAVAADGETVFLTGLRTFPNTTAAVGRIDPSSGQLSILTAFAPPLRDPSLISISPDGRTVIGGGYLPNSGACPFFYRLDAPGELFFTGVANLNGALDYLYSMKFSPDGRTAYLLGSTRLRVLNVKSPGVVEDSGADIPVQTQLPAEIVTTPDFFAVEPQGRYAYVGGLSIAIIDLKSRARIGTIASGARSISFPNPILADLGLTISVDRLVPYVGDPIALSITARNNGPRDATRIRISDRLPAGLSYLSHEATAGSYEPASCLWGLESLGQGDSAILTLRAKIEAGGPITDEAKILSVAEADPESSNDSASVTIQAQARPDFSDRLRNRMTADRAVARPGESLLVACDYRNSGGKATGVVISNSPDGLLEDVQPLDGGKISEGRLVWNLGDVPASGAGRVRFQARVRKGTPPAGKITARAEIVSNQTGPAVTNKIFVLVLR